MVVSYIFYFHPHLGKIPSLTNMFQMGWNHQPGGAVFFQCTILAKKSSHISTKSLHIFVSTTGCVSTSTTNLKANCLAFGGLTPPLFCLGTSPRPSWQGRNLPCKPPPVTEAKECEASIDLAFERIDVFNTAPRASSPETKGRLNSGRFRGENHHLRDPGTSEKMILGMVQLLVLHRFFWGKITEHLWWSMHQKQSKSW